VSLEPLLARASGAPARVVLAGGDVERLAAAVRERAPGLAIAAVLGPGGTPPEQHPRLVDVARLLRDRYPERVRDGIHALDLAADPLRLGAALVELGTADALVAGPDLDPDLLCDAALWALGNPEDGLPLRTAHWLLLAGGELYGMADCLLAGELDAAERAALARSVAAIHTRLGDRLPHVAFLGGPGGHDDEAMLAAAVDELARRLPGTPAGADRRVRFRERANVLIFPGGVSGHLALRTAREMSGALMLGPVLLGLGGVVAGVAEDAKVEEMAGTVALAALVAARAGT
jgi:phosphotransacetylase